MLLVAIDPGMEHTGVVVVENGSPILVFTFPVGDAIKLLTTIKGIDVVVLERPSLGPGADVETVTAWGMLRGVFLRDAIAVLQHSPGEWKPVAKAQNWAPPEWAEDPHQCDAYMLYLYWKWCGGEDART